MRIKRKKKKREEKKGKKGGKKEKKKNSSTCFGIPGKKRGSNVRRAIRLLICLSTLARESSQLSMPCVKSII